MTAAPRLATWDDLALLPEKTHAEILGGRVVVSPSPSPAHQGAVAELLLEYGTRFQRGRGGPGGWWLLLDVDVSFGPHDVLRPDLIGLRRDRVPEFPRTRPLTERPDWVCEVLSPGTAARDQGAKLAVYGRAGVPWCWHVDPVHRTIAVLRLTPEGYVHHQSVGDEGRAALAPFDAVEVDLTSLFPPA